MQDKIKTQLEIEKISQELKKQGKKIVTTNGSFDILHVAHVNLLEKARKEGDVLIILLNSDESIKKLKGKNRPIIPEKERAFILSALEAVDYVVIFNEDKPLSLLEKIKPHIHVKGGSFIEQRIKEEKELLGSWQGKFKNFDLEDGYSTTNIIEKIKNLRDDKRDE